MANSDLCSIEGCGNPVGRKGWCSKHYTRWKRHGCTSTRNRPANGEAAEYFRNTVLAYEGDECLVWPYYRMKSGYAILTTNGSPDLVSRLVCTEANGSPPTPEHQAAHSCGKGDKGCVTKRHIAWKTPKENNADKLIHGTHLRGERSPRAKLNSEIVASIRELAKTHTHREVAKIVGFSLGTVGRVVRREAWGDA